MLKFRTLAAVAALAAVAMLVPATAQAGAPAKADRGVVQLANTWNG